MIKYICLYCKNELVFIQIHKDKLAIVAYSRWGKLWALCPKCRTFKQGFGFHNDTKTEPAYQSTELGVRG